VHVRDSSETAETSTSARDTTEPAVLRPGDAGYDAARRVRNGLIDRRPALVARCAAVDHVVTAVRIARDRGLEIAVRAGGHGVAGRATTDGGVMIDVSPMRRVEIDAGSRTATARPGATWAELDAAAQAHGLATTGGVVSSTGVAGLTLGGGWGWLAGVHGLSVDNLLAADVVLADGRVVTASPGEHPDLFWALRGGGGECGVVVALRFRLHAVGPTLVGGLVAHPLDRARDLLRFHRELTASAPDALTVSAGLISAPDGTKLAALVGCFVGGLEEGERAMRAVREFGTPVLSNVGPLPYTAMNSLLDASFPAGALNYWKSSFVDALSDDAVDIAVDAYARCPSPMTCVVLDHWHGAATRVAPDATAFPHRRAGYSLLLLSQWQDAADTAPNVAWTRESYAALAPHAHPARYANFLDQDDLGDAALAAAYGANRRRLAEVRAAYDPDRVFARRDAPSPLP
jgi:FAD/FMN-containing dehydrogenase